MTCRVCIGVLLGCLLLTAFSVTNAETEHVVTLDSENFDEFLTKTDFALIEFYAPWCGHCKSLAPEYEKAAKMLKEEGSNIVLAKVNADDEKNKPLAKRFAIQGFPTLKIFQSAGHREYTGPREAEGIVAYIKKQAGPASQELSTAQDAEDFISQNPVAIVGLFSDYESEEYRTFSQIAEVMRGEYTFAQTKDASFLPDKGVPLTAPVVRVYKNFDEGFADVKVFTHEELKNGIEEASIPLVVEMSKDPLARPALMKVFSSAKSKALLFLDYESEDKTTLSDAYRAIAKEGKHNVDFIIGDAQENDHALQYFGVTQDDTPVLLIHYQAEEKKYAKPNVKPEEIDQFIQDFEDGKLVSKTKSEPIPEDNTGPVKVLVALNFEDMVFKSGKNVFIEFYAPWCGHCKKLTPIFETVGEEFANDNTVIVAKMDATANDIPSKEFDVKGFPTLYFVNAQGEIELYDGGRTKKDMVSYIKKHKTEPSVDASVMDGAEDIAEAAEAAVEKATEAVDEAVSAGKDEL